LPNGLQGLFDGKRGQAPFERVTKRAEKVQKVRSCNITGRKKALPDARAEGCEKTRGSGVKRELWGEIFILDFGVTV
jgi:hypothetical protein